MTVAQLLKHAHDIVGPQGDRLGVEVLLAYVLQKKKEYLIAHPQDEVSSTVEGDFRALFERFLKGEPVAYLTHLKEFYGLDFYVDQRVLIPRPETELLVEKILELVKKSPDGGHASSVRILDIGTGSGCIAIALASHLPDARVMAVDISKDALEVAALNAQKNGVADRITFLQSDLLQNLPADSSANFDVVVANLPYIGQKSFSFVSKQTFDFEPHVALFGGDDGLHLYEKLFQQLKALTLLPKVLLGEFGFLQAENLQALIRQYFPANQLEIFEDYAKIERIFKLTFA